MKGCWISIDLSLPLGDGPGEAISRAWVVHEEAEPSVSLLRGSQLPPVGISGLRLYAAIDNLSAASARRSVGGIMNLRCSRPEASAGF